MTTRIDPIPLWPGDAPEIAGCAVADRPDLAVFLEGLGWHAQAIPFRADPCYRDRHHV